MFVTFQSQVITVELWVAVLTRWLRHFSFYERTVLKSFVKRKLIDYFHMMCSHGEALVTPLDNSLPAFFGIRISITLFTGAHHWTLS
jgi:hypothetical protein